MAKSNTSSSSSSGSSKRDVELRLTAAAESAIESIGLGYDVVVDLRLKYCKRTSSSNAPKGSRLIAIDDDQVRDIAIPGCILVRNVPKFIKCDKGERMRFSSDVLSFQQMSEHFNQELSLSGKIPTGHFNAAFEFSGCWQKDAAYTKSLAFDGVFITLYSVALEKSHVTLCDHVKQSVPSSWDPIALARFIEKYGTHVIVGVKMGGKDVVYVKQQHSSPLQPADVQKKLKDMADKFLTESSGHSGIHFENVHDEETQSQGTLPFVDSKSLTIQKEDMTFYFRRRGGSSGWNIPYHKWCQTVQLEPEVISMSFIPISSLLSGIDGSGFLSHAINLYLRYKPPIEELHQFLEFQLPRQWAPVFGELPLGPERKQQSGASLQFSLMGPKLYVNTNRVDVGLGPVTGLRLYLEGKKGNCLAIHLQHLSSLPRSFQLHRESNGNYGNPHERRYFEKVQWKSFSHVCTAPVESEDDLAIVTGARFEVRESGMKNVLFLRLFFSKVIGATVVKMPEWDGSPGIAQKSGIISTLISSHFSSNQKPPPRPSDVHINSALYPEGPPMPAQQRKFLRFVDTTEMTRGPQDPPGYWVVSGARLVVDKGKISLRVKYAILAVILPDEESA